jgi:hypothetical protein
MLAAFLFTLAMRVAMPPYLLAEWAERHDPNRKGSPWSAKEITSVLSLAYGPSQPLPD